MAWRVKFAALAAVMAGVTVTALMVVGDLAGNDDRVPPAGGSFTDSKRDDAFVPARPGEDTYVLTDFEIEYPYDAVPESASEGRARVVLPGPGECGPDPGKAGVRYLLAWSGNDYPGQTECRIELHDASGELVGMTTWEVSALDPSIVRPQDFELAVPVSARPHDASAVCEASDYQPGPGYRFELVEVRPDIPHDQSTGNDLPMRSLLIFDVEFLVPNPDTRICVFSVYLLDGRTLRFGGNGTFSMGEERPVEYSVPIDDPDSITGADAECRTFTLEGPKSGT